MDGAPDVAGCCHLSYLSERALDLLGYYPSLWFDGVWHRSATLHDRASTLAGGLRRLGVNRGDRVVVLMANCPEVTVTYHAVWRIGAAVTPVVFLATAEEVRHVVVDAGATAVVTTAGLLPKVQEALDGLLVAVVVVGEGQATAPGTIDFAELEAEAPAPIASAADSDLAALLYTGGTTGRSKGVPLTHTDLYRGTEAARSVSYVPGVNRSIVALPLSHSFGLLVTIIALHAEEPVPAVLMRWFEPTAWLGLAVTQRVQVAAVVPSMVAMLLAQPLEEHDLSELRFLHSGAAPLPAAVAAEFERRVPSARVLEGYGLTETGAIVNASPPDAPKPSRVGKPVPGVSIRIVGPDGVPLPAGEPGEIEVCGPNVMAGYWRSAEPTGEWLATGDIGQLDDDGYLSIVDRKKDLIIRGGYNVYPRDVEDVLLTHPAVAAAAVVGRPDSRLGEEVVAFVALRPGSSAASGGVTPDAL